MMVVVVVVDGRDLQRMAWHRMSRQTGRKAGRQERRKGVGERKVGGWFWFCLALFFVWLLSGSAWVE